MTNLVYINFCGLHLNTELNESLYHSIENTAKVQASNAQDFKDKFEMIQRIIDDPQTRWLTLSFIQDYYRAVECGFKIGDFVIPYSGSAGKEINTFIWGTNASKIIQIRKIFMNEALKFPLKYKMRSINDLTPIRNYLNEFEKLFLNAVDEGVLISGDLSHSYIIKPHVFDNTNNDKHYYYDYCEWEYGDDDNNAVNSPNDSSPDTSYFIPQYWSASNASVPDAVNSPNDSSPDTSYFIPPYLSASNASFPDNDRG